MAQIETWLNQDMMQAVKVRYLDGNLFSQDNAGNLIGVKLTRDGEDYSGGGTVSANVIRSDGGTVAVTGALSGNVATVVLPQSAYAVPGVVSIVVKLTVSGAIITIAAVVANIYQSSTETAIDPGTIIPSIQTLIDQINTAVASIPADYSSLWTTLAPAFSTSTAYTAGQYVTYNGGLYRFTANHAAGSWSSSDVSAAVFGNELSDLKNEIELLPSVDNSNATSVDLDISDPSGNVILRLADGEIQTKKFNSKVMPVNSHGSDAEADIDLADINGNVVLRLKDGEIYAKNFNSEYVRQLTGKKWVVIGDSLTEHNQRATKNYHDYISGETGITVVNLGRSGRGYAKVADGINFTEIASRIPEDADVITIFGSGNDNSSGLDLGTATDSSTTTICGCINATLDAIYADFPLVPIGIITPTPWVNSEPSDGATAMSNYCAKIIEICALRGIPCLDLYHCSNLHPDDENFREIAYSKDDGGGVHPDENGHKIIAPRFRQFLFTLI